VRRNLGAEVFERLIEPFCSGEAGGAPRSQAPCLGNPRTSKSCTLLAPENTLLYI